MLRLLVSRFSGVAERATRTLEIVPVNVKQTADAYRAVSGPLDIWRGSCRLQEVASKPQPLRLGDQLRKSRTARELSLREMERRSGLNSGYLSQLERDEIANPTPAVLKKVSVAYEE